MLLPTSYHPLHPMLIMVDLWQTCCIVWNWGKCEVSSHPILWTLKPPIWPQQVRRQMLGVISWRNCAGTCCNEISRPLECSLPASPLPFTVLLPVFTVCSVCSTCVCFLQCELTSLLFSVVVPLCVRCICRTRCSRVLACTRLPD